MIGYYGLVTFLAVALLFTLYALVNQPTTVVAEQNRTRLVQATVVALQTKVATYPTPTPQRCVYGTSYTYGCP